tara:strand:+ start:3303 stop:3695 length:393 start_codon:yes stop_codon:yes gene_type:complete
MIQRIQSLFLLFSSFFLVLIIYKFPVLIDNENNSFFIESLNLIKWLLFLSVIMSTYAIFEFKNLQRQKIITYFSRLIITLVLVLIIFVYKEENELAAGFFLLIIPFILLLLANIYIKKDQKKISSADRIR